MTLARIVLLIALALAGCGSPPTHFYTLTSVAPAVPGAAAPSPCGGPPIAVRRVLLPDMLDRQSLVRAQGQAADRLDISSQDRWAAPLDRMTQRVLAEDLRERLPGQRVLAPGDPEPPGGVTALDVNVRRFLPDAAGQVSLQADWTLLDRHGKPVLTRSEAIGAGGPPAAEDVVLSMSHALGTLADRIATALAACPRRSAG